MHVEVAHMNVPAPVLESKPLSSDRPHDGSWKSLCRVGGTTALLAVVLAPAEVAISFLPGVETLTASTVTVVDWFNLFQGHSLLALRNLGLLNLIGAALLLPTILAVYGALRREQQAYAALGAILFFVGIAVYLAGSRAFPMLLLSRQYAAAVNPAQRALFVAAGQAMLAEGQSRAGILLIEFACFVVSLVMLRSTVFSRMTACAGLLGNLLMMVLEVAFMPPRGAGTIVAAGGGLATMLWYFLIGQRLLKNSRSC